MDFIKIGHGAIFIGEIADLGNFADVAIHRIDAFKGNDLWRLRVSGFELGFEVHQIIVLEDHAFGLGMADAFNHRGMVPRV